MGILFFNYLMLIVMAVPGTFGNRRNNKTTSTTANPVSKLLSKFHQNDYQLIFERIELIRFNTSLVNAQVRTFKFNRTTPVVNGSFILKMDVGNDMEVIVQAYKFASNEYREFPIRMQINLCEALAANTFGFNALSKENGNVTCPMLKGKKLYFYNFTPDASKFPPFIPSGKYMMECQFMYHSSELFVTYSYGIIDRPISIPYF